MAKWAQYSLILTLQDLEEHLDYSTRTVQVPVLYSTVLDYSYEYSYIDYRDLQVSVQVLVLYSYCTEGDIFITRVEGSMLLLGVLDLRNVQKCLQI